jgi:hypothetical protein
MEASAGALAIDAISDNVCVLSYGRVVTRKALCGTVGWMGSRPEIHDMPVGEVANPTQKRKYHETGRER